MSEEFALEFFLWAPGLVFESQACILQVIFIHIHYN
jgi:hypothetical protein